MESVSIRVDIDNPSWISAVLPDEISGSDLILKGISCCGNRDIRHMIEKDGTHRLSFGLDRVIIAHSQGLGVTEDAFLVVFDGNRTDRKEHEHGPFYAGRGLAAELQLPYISFSDPTLELSKELSIGWYAGNYKFPNYQMQVAKIIDAISYVSFGRPILVGGSGGGFAALLQSTLTNCETSAFVWNALTDLQSSQQLFTEPYARIAMPVKGEDKAQHPQTFARRLDEISTISRVHITDIRQNAQIVYVQNRTDLRYHTNGMRAFLGPSMNYSTRGDEHSTFSKSGNVVTWTGSWGSGHVAPPREIILETIEKLVRGLPPGNVVTELAADSISPIQEFETNILSDTTKLEVIWTREANYVIAHVNLMHPGKLKFTDVDYAFYLIADGKVADSIMYTEESAAKFVLPACKVFTIRGFAKDYVGTILNAFSSTGQNSDSMENS